MGDRSNSAGVSKKNEISGANADGAVPPLAAAEDDPLGHITTFEYRCDQPIRFGKRERSRSGIGSKAKAGQKPGRDGPDFGRAGRDHSGARNESSAVDR